MNTWRTTITKEKTMFTENEFEQVKNFLRGDGALLHCTIGVGLILQEQNAKGGLVDLGRSLALQVPEIEIHETKEGYKLPMLKNLNSIWKIHGYEDGPHCCVIGEYIIKFQNGLCEVIDEGLLQRIIADKAFGMYYANTRQVELENLVGANSHA